MILSPIVYSGVIRINLPIVFRKVQRSCRLFSPSVLYMRLNVIFDFLSNAIIHIYAKKVYNYIDIKNANSDKELEKKVINDVKSLSVIQITNAFINFTDTIIISKFVGIIQTVF